MTETSPHRWVQDTYAKGIFLCHCSGYLGSYTGLSISTHFEEGAQILLLTQHKPQGLTPGLCHEGHWTALSSHSLSA